MSEVLQPVEEFKTFNQFFYRRLKPDARPCAAPDEPRVVVSPADCRSVVFNRMDDATKIWVKGREFSVERLLGNVYREDAHRYRNGALGIFRLAPQDYHRFHVAVDGVMGAPKTIAGEYYTVNPMAIRSALDVYGENVRVVVPIDSTVFGRVMVVCVGAMMVGSTVITRRAGEKVSRAEELGYFKFGGSTLLLLFQEGAVNFDSDLVANSKGSLETYVCRRRYMTFWYCIAKFSCRFAPACPSAIVPTFLSSCLTCPRGGRTSPWTRYKKPNVGSKAVWLLRPISLHFNKSYISHESSMCVDSDLALVYSNSRLGIKITIC